MLLGFMGLLERVLGWSLKISGGLMCLVAMEAR